MTVPLGDDLFILFRQRQNNADGKKKMAAAMIRAIDICVQLLCCCVCIIDEPVGHNTDNGGRNRERFAF